MNTRIRALLYDPGRNLSAEMGYIESVIDDLADLGFNMMIINLERRFDFPSCPRLAPAGALTTDRLPIDLIPWLNQERRPANE